MKLYHVARQGKYSHELFQSISHSFSGDRRRLTRVLNLLIIFPVISKNHKTRGTVFRMLLNCRRTFYFENTQNVNNNTQILMADTWLRKPNVGKYIGEDSVFTVSISGGH